MPKPIDLEEDETLLYQELFSLNNHTVPFGIAISNKGIYKLKSKMFAVSDPYYFERIDKNKILLVEICRRKTLGLLTLSFIMILIGLTVIWYLLQGGQVEARGIGYGIATLAVGIIMPFVIPGRYSLRIPSHSGIIKWVPPLALDKTTKNMITKIFNNVSLHSKSIGIDVRDQRPTTDA